MGAGPAESVEKRLSVLLGEPVCGSTRARRLEPLTEEDDAVTLRNRGPFLQRKRDQKV